MTPSKLFTRPVLSSALCFGAMLLPLFASSLPAHADSGARASSTVYLYASGWNYDTPTYVASGQYITEAGYASPFANITYQGNSFSYVGAEAGISGGGIVLHKAAITYTITIPFVYNGGGTTPTLELAVQDFVSGGAVESVDYATSTAAAATGVTGDSNEDLSGSTGVYGRYEKNGPEVYTEISGVGTSYSVDWAYTLKCTRNY